MGNSIGNINELLTQLTNSQVMLNGSFSGLNTRVELLELKMKKYPVTSGEKRDIRKHVKSVVSLTVKNNGWVYSKVSRILFCAVYTEINDQYDVAAYDDLPRSYYGEIISKIDRWTPDAMLIERINKNIA